MKKILGTAAILAATGIFAAIFTFNSNTSHPDQDLSRYVTSKQGIEGAAEWLWKRRVNKETGELSAKDYLTALHEVEKHGQAARKSGREAKYDWTELGPDNIGGRVRALHIDKDNYDKLYAGGVAGGLYISEDAGETWQRAEGFNDVLPIGSIVQNSLGHLFVGTGEGDYTNFGDGAGGLPGNGIYKSEDGGLTFTHLSSTATSGVSPNEDWAHVNRLAAHATDANTLYAATSGGLWYTTDGGTNWTHPTGAVSSSFADDVKIGIDGTVYAAIGGNFYRATDGENFTDLSQTYATTNDGPAFAGRLELAPSPVDANYIFAITAVGGSMDKVYRSNDQGNSWIVIGNNGSNGLDDFGGQGNYNLAITASPINKQRAFIAGQYITCRSGSATNWTAIGGSSFGGNYIHPDMHIIVFEPGNENNIYVGCDGGIFKSTSGGSPWSHASVGLNVTQYYGCAASLTGEVTGGTQDNGTHYIDFKGPDGQSGDQISGGDGGYTEISKLNPNVFFAASQYGALRRSQNKGNNFNGFYDNRINPNDLVGDPNYAGFVTPFRLYEDLQSGKSLFAVGLRNSVWITNEALDFGSTPTWFQLGLTATSGINTVECMEFSNDGRTLYVGTETGVLYRITGLKDANYQYISGQWDPADEGIVMEYIGLWGGQSITGIGTNPNNPKHIIATLGNYGKDNYMYMTQDALLADNTAVVWEDIQGDLPKFPVYDAVIDWQYASRLTVATEFGIFYSDNSGENWVEENDKLGRIATFMIRQEQNPEVGNELALYLATHGRGIWTDAYKDAPVTGISNNKGSSKMNIFPNPMDKTGYLRASVMDQGNISINIFDLSGKLIRRDNLGVIGTGELNYTIDTQELSTGSYLLMLQTDSQTEVRKILVVH